MKQSGVCPKCGSKQVVKNSRVVDRDHGGRIPSLVVCAPDYPEQWKRKDERHTELAACVCAECGYAEFYATDPTRLTPNQ